MTVVGDRRMLDDIAIDREKSTPVPVVVKAHSQLDVLYEVRTLGAETFQVAELQLFISKLSGPSIGFTVLGIITVSKEMIFTLGGILTSYFFLLLQYQI